MPLPKRTEGLLTGISEIELKYFILDPKAGGLRQLQTEITEPLAIKWSPQESCNVIITSTEDRKTIPTLRIVWENENKLELDVSKMNFPAIVLRIMGEREAQVIKQEALDAETDEAEDSTESILQQNYKNWNRDKQIQAGFDPDNEIPWADHEAHWKTKWVGKEAIEKQEKRVQKFKEIYFPARQQAALMKRLKLAEKGNMILTPEEVKQLGKKCPPKVAKATEERAVLVAKHNLDYFF